MRVLPALLLSLCVLAACSAPPQKEVDLAQGAIDAARAAGAEQYAPEEVAAANVSLQEAHDAVAQRDYRLALTRALDAHDRALEAAKAAAEGQVRARSEIDAAIAAARRSVDQFQQRLEAPDAARLPKKDLEAATRALAALEADLQKARAAVATGDYAAARGAVDGISGRISAHIEALDAAAARKPARPGRRGR